MNRDFFNFIAQSQSGLRKDAFETIVRGAPQAYPLQPWPLFVGPEQHKELASIALPIDRLVRSVFDRFLGNDPACIADFYRTNSREAKTVGGRTLPLELSEQTIMLLLEGPNGLDAAPSRGDYMHSPDGLKCIEFNAGGTLGGLQVENFTELYLKATPIATFAKEYGVTIWPPSTLATLFLHIIEDTRRRGIWERGDFNVAMLIHPNKPERLAIHSAELYTERLQRALAHYDGGEGRVLLCAAEDFSESPAGLHLHGRRVHAIVEQHDGGADRRRPFRHFKRGTVNLFSGPGSRLLDDKRNIALLSTHADSDDFTEAERQLIARHIPWSRQLKPAKTTFRGRPLRIPEDVSVQRQAFALKKGTSAGGTHVHLGRTMSESGWNAVIERALQERDWIVQECVTSAPYWFQTGLYGAERHDVIWGLYVFGAHFGGVFLRMGPSYGEHEIINTHRGAEVGMVLSVDR